MASLTSPPPDATATSATENSVEEHALMKTLQLLDPVVQFLTKATGFTSVALLNVRRTLPTACFDEQTFQLIRELSSIGILHLFLKPSDEHNGDCATADARWDDCRWQLGFSSEYPLLQGCTKTAAKRRVAALKKILKERNAATKKSRQKKLNQSSRPSKVTEQAFVVRTAPSSQIPQVSLVKQDTERVAREAFHLHFQLDYLSSDSESNPSIDSNPVVEHILPGQLAWAESLPAQEAVYADLSTACIEKISSSVLKSYQLNNRKLFSHQSRAIESTLLHRQHTAICTGTGSGKSLCFWLPVTSAAVTQGETSLVIFPTKALAQDQLIKLQSTLDDSLLDQVSPATLDGDSPMSRRCSIVETAKILLTNPDTIHASLLSSKDEIFKRWLSRLRYVVLDEAHTYDGVFGAHVAMILRRLIRVVAASGRCEKVTFVCASATLTQPEIHFRRLCPVGDDEVTVIVDDGSPRAAKHFFVWNPPLLWRHMDGRVQAVLHRRHTSEEVNETHKFIREADLSDPVVREREGSSRLPNFTRRHAADETALLFARLVQKGVRCIVFCKTRNLVEWVFEKASKILGEKDCQKIESYRGGYTLKERREIERKLFSNHLLGVISTNALELGVDVGAIDVTLHCGYPSSHTSLMQQAGRAGRGLHRTPSLSVMICFGSVTEQYIWRHPKTLLGKGVDAVVLESTTSPMTTIALLQGHMICAANEFPLTGENPVTDLSDTASPIMSDWELFGGKEMYLKAAEALVLLGSLIKEPTSGVVSGFVLRAHRSLSRAWSTVSLRSIEPINYLVVDISHYGQQGRMDCVHDEAAVIDTLPYSRVFYHAHPGAIITHRGRKYKILSMTRPPLFSSDHSSSRRNHQLAAFAKPCQEKYYTRPLSNLIITVVNQVEMVQMRGSIGRPTAPFSIGGRGTVCVKRSVHGYKRLSLISRQEISRAELSLPSMEYETFGLWLDSGAHHLMPVLGNSYGLGVHALCHALLAVAPHVCPGLCRWFWCMSEFVEAHL
ncbi:DEAD/DEAH box helicase domain-containing protein [Fistulifera solaris]|uniref:DEAD/DEAH box helicase domain-containing protein n=1 Tax=Fistulifera solaris TaxID=1519565 RepID=A0A1Z5J8C7_FISSO|nr:DEAD/DEAH box helicase domain-containing protein [Fistulifera solaris]|eukprot:GAX10253.1 DEAD/DEAH box helicase domain-containing protein [Fistulifera solaris]